MESNNSRGGLVGVLPPSASTSQPHHQQHLQQHLLHSHHHAGSGTNTTAAIGGVSSTSVNTITTTNTTTAAAAISNVNTSRMTTTNSNIIHTTGSGSSSSSSICSSSTYIISTTRNITGGNCSGNASTAVTAAVAAPGLTTLPPPLPPPPLTHHTPTTTPAVVVGTASTATQQQQQRQLQHHHHRHHHHQQRHHHHQHHHHSSTSSSAHISSSYITSSSNIISTTTNNTPTSSSSSSSCSSSTTPSPGPPSCVGSTTSPSPVLGMAPTTTVVLPDNTFDQGACCPTQSCASVSSRPPEESSVQAADSNSPKQTFVPCKVCGDRASGYHYGVTSCEGCKGFFRRSIQKQIEYRCLRDGKCMVIRLNRNRCQYCRFKKCLAVGMSRDSVRYGRVPKRSKSLDDQRIGAADSSQDATSLENKQLEIYDTILNVSQAHLANCALTEDKLKIQQRKSASLLDSVSISTSLQLTEEEVKTHRLMMWENLASLITPSIQSIVEFAKRVPGFPDLSQDDQLILIKSGFFEMWLSRQTRTFNSQDNCVTFEDGSTIVKNEMVAVYQIDFVNTMFELTSNFNQLNLNDTEVGLFVGIVLATADRQGLTDTKGVEKIQDKLIEALKLQISRNHSTEEHLYANTIMKLPELRTLGTWHNELLQWYRSQWKRLKVPPLYAEIYDIPKNEEDSQA